MAMAARVRFYLMTSVLAIASTSAYAQDAAPAQPAEPAVPAAAPEAPSGGLEEIVVTARRTEENIQRTPVAVTALGAETIRNQQIVDVSGLQRSAPSLSITSNGSPAGQSIVYVSIRGGGNLQVGLANDPAVGIYIDGVYIPRPTNGLTDLFDVQRAEVLRGPQGTLFGRNTTGGALNIVTARPTGVFEGSVLGEIGNYRARDFGLILNVPIAGDELAARVAYKFSEHDGYGHNASLDDRDVNDRNSHFVRAKIRYAPNGSDWSVTLSGDYNHIKDSGQFVGLRAANPAVIGTFVFPGAPLPYPDITPYIHTKANWYTMYGNDLQNYRRNQGPFDRATVYGFSASVEGTVGGVDVRSITAYRNSNSDGLNELDGTPVSLFDSDTFYISHQWSQELQALGTIGDHFNYIIGGYYSRETGTEGSEFTAFGFLGTPNHLNDGDVTSKSAGLFAQGYYKLTDTLRLAGGLRWTWDKRKVVLHNLNIVGLPGDVDSDPFTPGVQPNCADPAPDGGITQPCNQTQSASFDYPAWTVGLDYQATRDIFLYAKGSAASQSGGFNLRVGSIPAFTPTKTTEVEVGAKTSWLDNRLRVNVALFHDWQSSVQRNVNTLVDVGTPNQHATEFVRNAGDTRIYGAEFEVTVAPWTGMLVNGNLSLLRGHYADGSFTEDQQLPDGSFVAVDRSGEALPQLPRYQFGVGATQKITTTYGEVSLHLDYGYIARQFYEQVTPAAGQPQAVKDGYAAVNRLGIQDGYGLLNGRAGIQLAHPNIELYAFGKNLTQKKYAAREFSNLYAGAGVALEYIGDPRTYGVGVRFAF